MRPNRNNLSGLEKVSLAFGGITIGLILGFLVSRFINIPGFNIVGDISLVDSMSILLNLLSIFVTIFLAIYISRVIERVKDREKTVKEFLYSRISYLEKILLDLDSEISTSSQSENGISYFKSVSTCKQLTVGMKRIKAHLKNSDQVNDLFQDFIEKVGNLNSRLTTTSPNAEMQTRFVQISNNKIILPENLKGPIIAEISSLTDALFDLRFLINETE